MNEISNEKELKIERTSSRSEHHDSYGFIVYRPNGYSLPKGMISSFCAIKTEVTTPYEKWDIRIEFSVQSPTGDASDFYHYTMQCDEWGQAKAIVDQWFSTITTMVETNNYIQNKMDKMVIYPKQYLYT